MSAVRRRAVRLVRRARALAALPRAWSTSRTLVAAGVVDRPWLELQAGRSFADDRSAARWYAATGRGRGASPHPLVEPEWVAPVTWRLDRVDPAVQALDPGAPRGAHPLLPQPGALAAALRDLGPGTVLDAWTGPVHYDRWRATAFAAQEVETGHQALKKVRTTTTWDASADAEFVARWAHAPLPDEEPLVSIVMPVRNRPVVVLEAIRSVRDQTLGAFELLVVDDGSTDDTADVIAAAAAADPRIRLLRRSHAGVCAARNAGIEAARAPYLAFLDSDNEWTPDFLRVAVAAMRSESLDVAFAVVEEISERGRRYRTFQGGATDLQMGNFVDLNVLVCRTEVVREVGGFDPSLRRMVDYDLVWKLADRGPVRLLPFVGVVYSGHSDVPDRISTTESPAWDDVVKIRHMVDWPALRQGLASRRDDLVAVVVPCRSDHTAAVGTVRSLLGSTPSSWAVEVVVVENSSTPGTWRLLWAQIGLDPRVRLVRAPVNLHRAAGSSYGLPHTQGSVIVVVPAGTELGPDDLDRLVEPVRSGSAEATVAGAGADVVATRAATLVDLGGLEALFTNEFEVPDLVRRISAGGGRVETASVTARVVSEYERPTPVQHAANVREWERRHGAAPVPASRVAR